MHTSVSKEGRGLNHQKTLPLLLQAVIVLSLCSATTQAQGRSRPSARETIRQIQKSEMDRLLLLAPLTVKKDSDPNTVAVLKQLREDFKTMQSVNNKMMAEVWEREEIDYEHVSGMISQINGRATRLKANLLLPESKLVKKEPLADASTAKEFRGVLMRLDQSIMSFVANPLFQKSNVIEVSLATKAHHDLEEVIVLSGNVKKIAAKLNETSKRAH